MALLSAVLAACNSVETAMDVAELKEFGTKYTAAWCSQNAASVAAFFAESGSLRVNDGAPSVGRTANCDTKLSRRGHPAGFALFRYSVLEVSSKFQREYPE